VVSVFDSKDFPNFFRDGYSSSGYDLSEEWDVLFVYLDGHYCFDRAMA